MAHSGNFHSLNKKIERVILLNATFCLLVGLVIVPFERAEASNPAAPSGGKLFFTCSSRDIRQTAYKLCSVLYRKRSKRHILGPFRPYGEMNFASRSSDALQAPALSEGRPCGTGSADRSGCNDALMEGLPPLLGRGIKGFSHSKDLSAADFIVPYWERRSPLLQDEGSKGRSDNYVDPNDASEEPVFAADDPPEGGQKSIEIPFMTYEEFVEKLDSRDALNDQELMAVIRHNLRSAGVKRGGGGSTVGDIRSYCCMHGCSDEHLIGLCLF